MKNKVIDLFSKPQMVVQNTDVKYSQLLEKLLETFAQDFEDLEYHEDIIEFGINAWNCANMKLILPKEEYYSIFGFMNNEDKVTVLLNKMIDYKLIHFKDYPNFIVDYDFEQTDEDPILKITTQEQDSYLKSMVEIIDEEEAAENFNENYIDRSAIIVKPLQPFIDWCSNLYPEEIADIKETRTYLISDEIEDINTWIQDKYDKIFTFELESCNDNKKEWPQKRNYKMFKEWFQIDISTIIYDFEKNPILKMS